MQKKYHCVVSIAQSVSTSVGAVGLGLETTRIARIATGESALSGIVLSALGRGGGILC